MELSDLIEALGDRERAVPTSKFDDEAPNARHCGIYAWWADEAARRLIEDTLGADAEPPSYDAASPIYIGITTRHLGDRVQGDHLDGSFSSSTLRRTLAAILMTDPTRAAKHPDPRDVAWRHAVSDWMLAHLAVTIIPLDCPGLVEGDVIASYDPPLNLDHVGRRASGRVRLLELRRQRRLALAGDKRLPLG